MLSWLFPAVNHCTGTGRGQSIGLNKAVVSLDRAKAIRVQALRVFGRTDNSNKGRREEARLQIMKSQQDPWIVEQGSHRLLRLKC